VDPGTAIGVVVVEARFTVSDVVPLEMAESVSPP
jgi:hypothetical protein